MLYLLDTNILLAYVRRGALFVKIDALYGLSAVQPEPLISIVTEGEMRVLAEEFQWGATRKIAMETLLSSLTVVPLPFSDSTAAYVEASEYSRRRGRTMGKNDLWIAATAMTTGATLLTTDRDFDHFAPPLLSHQWIDPAL